MYIVLLICIVLFLISLRYSKNNIFAPGVITSSIWIVCLSLYLLLNHDLPPLSNHFLMLLLTWIVLLVVSSILMQKLNFSQKKILKSGYQKEEPNLFIRDIYLTVSVIAFIFFLYWVYRVLNSGDDTYSWGLRLRREAMNVEKNKIIYLNYLLWQLAFLLELAYFSKKKWYRVFIPALFCLSIGFFAMAKGFFLTFFIQGMCILYFKKQVVMKHFLLGIIITCLIFLGIQRLRGHYNSVEKQVSMYVLSGMAALDKTVVPFSSSYFGENVFRITYAVPYRLGLSDIEPIDPYTPFVKVPILTNTYTVLYPYYKDFGYWGIVIFAIFSGCFFGWIFRKACQGLLFYIILCSYFSNFLVVQFGGEALFTFFAAHFRFVLFLYLPFFISKQKWAQKGVLKNGFLK